MNSYSMVASDAKDKKDNDVIYTLLQEASDAIAILGKGKVINSTIGAIFDDEGTLAILPSVAEYYRKLSDDDYMNVTPIGGMPEYQQAVIDFVFRKYLPKDSYAGAVSTVGGNGAVRHVFKNYLEKGDIALIPDFFWVNYPTIAAENDRTVDRYQMFDENNCFSLKSLKKKVIELLKVQNNIVIILNSPGHNPTGYSLTDLDWKDLLDFLKNMAQNKNKKIIIMNDLAYLDYTGDQDSTRTFLKEFGQLPANILYTMAFSMSKSFTAYGLRCGALVALSSSKNVIQEFLRVNAASSRGVWSTAPRGPQRFLIDVMKNPALRESIDKDRNFYIDLLAKRAKVFLTESSEVNLPITPYKSGFFVTVPTTDPLKVANKLKTDNIFLLPMEKGLRIALCAIPTSQIYGLARKIVEAMD